MTRRHFLVVGGQRCGTTYLHGLLDAHPDIAMARPARPEPKVFLSDEASSRGLDWYRATYFAHATSEQVLGDKSTSYLEDPRAADRVTAVLGEAAVLVLVRDPVERAVSNWRFSTDNGFETRPLVQALTESLERSAGWDAGRTSTSPFAYLERGRYAELLAPWLAAQPDRVHVFLTAELVADPGVVSQVYRSLGVDPAFDPPGPRARLNASRQAPSPLPGELVSSLRRYFEPSDDALRRLLGRELPWTAGDSTGLSRAR